MMNKKKKIIFVCIAAAAAAAVSLSVGLTIAYLGRTKEKVNTITVGHGDGEISEEFTEPSVATMDNKNDKTVWVKNTGTVPVFARVYMNFSDSRVADKAKITYNDGTTDQTDSWSVFLNAMKSEVNGWKYIAEDDENDGDTLGGYFYYTKALEVESSGNQTTELIKAVEVDFRDKYENGDPDPNDSNIDKIQPYELIVYSELVQTVETGYIDNQNSKIYGYDYNKDDPAADEWRKAWKSYLAKDKKIAP